MFYTLSVLFLKRMYFHYLNHVSKYCVLWVFIFKSWKGWFWESSFIYLNFNSSIGIISFPLPQLFLNLLKEKKKRQRKRVGGDQNIILLLIKLILRKPDYICGQIRFSSWTQQWAPRLSWGGVGEGCRETVMLTGLMPQGREHPSGKKHLFTHILKLQGMFCMHFLLISFAFYPFNFLTAPWTF